MRPRVRRDDDARYTEAEAYPIGLRRRNVVVPAAPVVPQNEDRRVVPVLALADAVDDRGDPRRAACVAARDRSYELWERPTIPAAIPRLKYRLERSSPAK